MNQWKPDGFAALGMLAKRYNPKTPSRILHALIQVLSLPTKGKLTVEFGEEMFPSDLKDKVFEMVNAGVLKFHQVRDAIVGIMNNRARVLEPWIFVKLDL